MFREEGEDIGHGVGGGRGGGSGDEMPPGSTESDGEDAVKAEEGERTGDGEAEAAVGGVQALLLSEAALEVGLGC